MPANKAAYLVNNKGKALEVRSAPYTKPGPCELVVKNGAVAVNPADYGKQKLGDLMLSWIKYPFILGSDLAGEVVEVGEGVTRFKPGDRVVAFAVGADKRRNRSCEGAFQEYSVIRSNLTSVIPKHVSFEKACVLPLAIGTASCGLFMKDFLGLQHPSLNSKPTGETLLVWGGSTSVGMNAIQLAVAAGYEVISTSSRHNFDLLKTLGASHVFDYNSRTVGKDIITLLKGKKSAGAIALGNGSLEACLEIISASNGKKLVAQGSIPGDISNLPESFIGLIGLFFGVMWWNFSMAVKSRLKGVGKKFIWGSDLMENEVSKAIFEDFLPEALEEGKYLAAPDPIVAGQGLESIQLAFELHAQGVSAKKVVVTL